LDIVEIIKAHQIWLESEGKKGTKAIFTGSDLHDFYFCGYNLNGADLRETNLSDADLNGVYLCEADLSSSNLSNADLSGAQLIGVNLKNANLEKANISNADLTDINLNSAFLNSANLSGATLSGAIFVNANLKNADLYGSIIDETIFSSISLDKVKNLEKVNHFGPSTIGTDTLIKSKGKIPVEFLKGCGLLDWEIENSKLYRERLTNDEIINISYEVIRLRGERLINLFPCFLSHSAKDKDFVIKLHDTLQSNGVRCWLAKKELLPGQTPHKQINRGIELWDKTLLFCSKASLTESGWVDYELRKAHKKERDLQRKLGKEVDVLIPIDLDGFLFSNEYESELKDLILERTVADFTDCQYNNVKYEEKVNQLIRALIPNDGGVSPAPKSFL